MHESLEKIKEYSSYYDWYDHISIYDLRFLISQAEKVEQLQKQVEYWQKAHRDDCAELQLKIIELKKK